MERLYIWFNPNNNQFYYKFCRNCNTRIGGINQYNHVLCTTLTLFDKKIHSNLTDYKCYKIMAQKRNNRYKRLFDKFKN